MPIQRGSQKVIKRYRGAQEILASNRGAQRFYSSEPPVNPYTLGAVSWLPLNGDLSDHGTNSALWNPGGTPDFGDGFLRGGSVQPQFNNSGFAFDPSAGASLSAWLYVPSSAEENMISSVQATASFSEISFSTLRSGTTATSRATFRMGATASGTYVASGTFPVNTWTFFVATMAPETGNTWRVRQWRNGANVHNTTRAMGNPQPITFNGARLWPDSRVWVDDVGIYNRALTPEEVMALYSAGPN